MERPKNADGQNVKEWNSKNSDSESSKLVQVGKMSLCYISLKIEYKELYFHWMTRPEL